MSIGREQVEAYENEGVLSPVPVAAEAEATRYRQLFDELEAKVGKEKAQIGLLDAHFQERFIWELATHPRVLGAVEALIGPDILLLATHFFCKYGQSLQSDAFVAWHQDVTYWGLDPAVAITAWYAVDDSDVGNGCMRVIPGTHNAGIYTHHKSEQEGNLLSINQTVVVSKAEERRAVDLILRAGEMSLHDGLLVHGSLPNGSSRRRCGLTLRYIPTRVRQGQDNSVGARWQTILVCGQDREYHFTTRRPPF